MSKTIWSVGRYVLAVAFVLVLVGVMTGASPSSLIGDSHDGESQNERVKTSNGDELELMKRDLNTLREEVQKTKGQVQTLKEESDQTKEEVSAQGLRLDEHDQRLGHLEAPLAQFVLLLTTPDVWTYVVSIQGKSPRGTFKGTGFAINPSTIGTIWHTSRDIEKELGPEARVTVTFEFLEGKPQFVLEESPVYLPDGLFAYYTLSEKDTKRVKALDITYPILASEAVHSELSVGDTIFQLAHNFRSIQQRGSLITPSVVEYVGYKKTAWRFFIDDFLREQEAHITNEKRFSQSLGTTRNVPGDSGAPQVAFNEKIGAFVVVTITDTFFSSANAYVLADSLREAGIPFRDAESLVEQEQEEEFLDAPLEETP